MSEHLHLPDDVRAAILAHAAACVPNECCGLLASDPGGRIRFAYPLTNCRPSPTSYTIAPEEHFAALTHAERNGWELTGVFHSHPKGPATPSVIDVQAALEPGWTYLILGRGELRGFRIRGRQIEEISLT